MIEMRRAQLSFGDGFIAEEVSDLREDWMEYADQALADFTKYLALKPDDPYGYGERATIYESRAQWSLALAEYNQVIKLIPNEVYGYGNRGMIYLQLKIVLSRDTFES